jgi:hypothetical protein
MTAPMNQFMTDEYVLAYHGPLLYEARVSLITFINFYFELSLKADKQDCANV